jgi:hypothetical protein
MVTGSKFSLMLRPSIIYWWHLCTLLVNGWINCDVACTIMEQPLTIRYIYIYIYSSFVDEKVDR